MLSYIYSVQLIYYVVFAVCFFIPSQSINFFKYCWFMRSLFRKNTQARGKCFKFTIILVEKRDFLFQTRFTVPRTWVFLQLSVGLFANIITMNVYPTVTNVTANCIVIYDNRLLTYLARKLNHLVEVVFPYFLCK